MPRKYDYRRKLPHLQKDCKALFITFCTKDRWIIPDMARTVVLEVCLYSHEKRFTLFGAVVMPDHVHLVLLPLADSEGMFSISEIMQGIKSTSAHRINKLLGRKGIVWQQESFDHVLRVEEGIAEKVNYIINNPVRAGLAERSEQYPWLWYPSLTRA
ncbi:MAG TPA: transposase [Terriglobales bacterium]|nr:transposase [Terriglobales bacterium]